MSQYNIAELFQPHSFPSRLTPEYIRFTLLLNGMALPPTGENEPLRHLELGPGQGERINIHAASIPHWEFWGIGDNSQNARLTSETAMRAGISIHLPEINLEALTGKDLAGNLPKFDIIVIGSAFSRINEEQRQYLLGIVNTCLKPTGVICIGYHSLPGCASLFPVRDFMLQQMVPGLPEEEKRIQALKALYFADTYAETGSGFFADMPQAKACLDSIKNTPFQQLENDWLDPNWKPFYFADISRRMEDIGCTFATSLNLYTWIDMCLPEGVLPLLHEEDDPILRESIRDFGLNQLTRLDIFSRTIPLVDNDRIESEMTKLAFCLTAPLSAITAINLPSPSGQLVFDDEIYLFVLRAMADENYRPKTISELQTHPLLREVDSTLLLALINILVAADLVCPTPTAAPTPATENACARLNRLLCELSLDGETSPALASPILGNGISLSRIAQLFLLFYVDGMAEPAACAKAVLDLFTERVEPLLDQNGTPLEASAAIVALEKDAHTFFANNLPYLMAMKVMPGPNKQPGAPL